MNKNEDSVIDVSFIYMILLRALAVQQYDRLWSLICHQMSFILKHY